MLTKTDLSEIQKIVHTEIQSETSKIVKKELKPIKKDILLIKADINLIVRTFDRDYVLLRKRVEHLETHASPVFTHA